VFLCPAWQEVVFCRIFVSRVVPQILVNKFDPFMAGANLDRRSVAVVWLMLNPGNRPEVAFT
jgi:hypothetical protein